MGRLVLWLALAVLLPAPAILQPLDQVSCHPFLDDVNILDTQAVLEEQEQMKELLTSMFIDNHREGRDLEEDMDEEEMGEARDMDDENEDETNLVDDEADTEEGVEVVSSKDPQEIARFNNYMDAIYRCTAQPSSLLSNHLCVHSTNQSLSYALSPINSSSGG